MNALMRPRPYTNKYIYIIIRTQHINCRLVNKYKMKIREMNRVYLTLFYFARCGPPILIIVIICFLPVRFFRIMCIPMVNISPSCPTITEQSFRIVFL